MTVRSFARLVNRMTGNKLDNLEFLPMRLGEEVETAIRAKGEGWDKLGWQPEFSPAHLEEAINWYRP
jgi:nucleoside-diphosphate-sugar epimerase